MKIVIFVAGALFVGAALGVAGTWAEFRGLKPRFEPDNGQGDMELDEAARKNADTMIPATPGAHVQVVNGETFDFGQIERKGSLTHDFIFKNVGTAPLRLEDGGTSCAACTIASLAKNELQPGETTAIALKWTAMQMEPDYHKEAYIRTSDSKRQIVRLTVEGKVVSTIHVSPSELQLKNIVAGEGTTDQIYLWNFRDEPLRILSQELTDADTAEFFEVTHAAVTAEEMGNSLGAKSGHVVTVTVKPGLPLGSISQTIRLQTNLKGMDQIDVPVSGTVLGDITLFGGTISRVDAGLVVLGGVKQAKGGKTTIYVRVKGLHRHDIQLKVAKVDPADVLQVHIGEPKEPDGGTVVIFPVTVEVPAGSRTISRLGSVDDGFGRILIETTHPVSKELPLKVRFLVAE